MTLAYFKVAYTYTYRLILIPIDLYFTYFKAQLSDLELLLRDLDLLKVTLVYF